MSGEKCPLGEDCDLTLAWMMGAERAKDTIKAQAAEIDRLKTAVRVAMGQAGRLQNKSEQLHAVLQQIAAGRGDPVAVAHAAIAQRRGRPVPDDRDMDAMMADGLLSTVREAAQGLYGDVQTYPCDDVKRVASEVDQLRRKRTELLDRLHGTPCAQIRWQQEREELQAANERLQAALSADTQTLRLHLGEMSAQEMRTLKAGFAWVLSRAAIAAQPAPSAWRTDALVTAANAIIDFYNGPAEAKRPDIFQRLMQRLANALPPAPGKEEA